MGRQAQHSDGQRLEIRAFLGGARTPDREQINLGSTAHAFKLGHDRGDGAILSLDLVLLARAQRQIGEDAIEGAHPLPHEPPQRLVHEQDRAALGDGKHRQADRFCAAPANRPLGHIFEPPEKIARADTVNREPQMASPGHEILARGPRRLCLALQAAQHRARISEEFRQGSRQALPTTRAEPLHGGAVLIADLALGIRGKTRRGVMGDEIRERFLLSCAPPSVLRQGQTQPDRRDHERPCDGEHGPGHHLIGHHEGNRRRNSRCKQQIDRTRRQRRHRLREWLQHQFVPPHARLPA